MTEPTFRGRTVLVTGGGSGIGREMVTQFSAAGASVVAADVDRERLSQLAKAIPWVATVVADVSTAAGADSAIAACGEAVDVLCNNAGISDGLAFLDEATDELWIRVLAVNLTSAFLMSKRVLPGMLERAGGVIINTASIAGLRGGRAGVAYTASKFGMVGMTQNIAATFGPAGIRCNAICPGGVQTEIGSSAKPSARSAAHRTRDGGRPDSTTPDRVAAVAVWLASDAAAHVNGAAIPVDGGWIAY